MEAGWGFRNDDGLVGLFEAFVKGCGAANLVSSFATSVFPGCFIADGRIDDPAAVPIGFLLEISMPAN